MSASSVQQGENGADFGPCVFGSQQVPVRLPPTPAVAHATNDANKPEEDWKQIIRRRNATWGYSNVDTELEEDSPVAPVRMPSSTLEAALGPPSSSKGRDIARHDRKLHVSFEQQPHGSPDGCHAGHGRLPRQYATAGSSPARQRRDVATLSLQTLDLDALSMSSGGEASPIQGSASCSPPRTPAARARKEKAETPRSLPSQSRRSSSWVGGDRAGRRPNSLPLTFSQHHVVDSIRSGEASQGQGSTSVSFRPVPMPTAEASASLRGLELAHASKANTTLTSFASSAHQRPVTLRTDLGTIRTTATGVTHATAITAQTHVTCETTMTTKTLWTRITTLSEFLHAMPFGFPLLMLSKPVFIISQVILTLGLWLLSWPGFNKRGGLDELFSLSGQTDLRLSTSCEDHRAEVWRWLTYQFSHTGFMHVASNTFMLVICIPLERFHGSKRIWAIFNAGVFGGACVYFLFDSHHSVIGMSGGNFALMGMYVADLALNWGWKDWKTLEVLCFMLFGILILFEAGAFESLLPSTADISVPSDAKAAHSVHAGGFLCGVLVTVGIGRMAKRFRTRMETRLQVLSLVTVALVSVTGIIWGQQWPPSNLLTNDGWCWTREVFGSRGEATWSCEYCEDKECIEAWLASSWVRSNGDCYAGGD